MASLLAMFPGQGSQYVGMGKSLLEEFPAAKAVFEEAEDACRVSIRKLCIDGPKEQLDLTAHTQPCLLAASVAVWSVLVAETGVAPSGYAGHSLGEYSALVAAGKLSLARAAYLVRRRGEFMQEAVPQGVGAMAAVLKLSYGDLEEACRKHSQSDSFVEIANYNSKDQLVVAGHRGAVEALVEDLSARKIRCVMLPVSAPFHSRLMAPAREAMEPLLLESEIVKNDRVVLANLTGKEVADYGASYLIEQIDSPVLWAQTMETALESGRDTYLEIGPGKVLFGLARRGLPKGEVRLFHTENVKETIKALQGL